MKWVIQSKDRTQFVGKNLYDSCEDINKARTFNSKFEAEQFLDKHCKTLISGYWKVIAMSGVEEKKSLKESTKKDIMKEVAKLIRNILKEGGYDNARVQIYQDLSVECLVWGNRKIRDYVISELEKYPNFKFNGEYEDDYVWEDGGHTIYLTIL